MSYDPSVLTLLTASAADLTKSFSVEKTALKSGSVSLVLRSNKGITGKEGGLIELQFETHSQQHVTTTLHVDSAAVWDETECSKSILDIKGGQLTVITGIEKIPNELPKTYSLSQNYPNPFNPSTKIRFEIPVEGKVTIKIYDILGREVSTLLNENKPAGSFEVEWNAKNYASGVYIYRLTSRKTFLVKKMMLVK